MFEKGKGSLKSEEEERNQKILQFESYFKNLEPKFQEIKKEINEMPKNVDLFKNHQLPLARIKKIMKSDEDVRVLPPPRR
jgi:molybdopterin synthase catalytic subunit